MRMRSPNSHPGHKWIKRVEADGAGEALDRCFRLALPVFHPATPKPHLSQIGVERKRPIDQRGTYPQIACDKCQGISACSERDYIILSQLDRPLSEPSHFSNFVRCN